MTGQVGGFQNPGVCLQAFLSFLPHPLSALLLVPFFARSLTLVSRSLLLNRTETLAAQAMIVVASNDNESSQVTLPGFLICVPVPVIRGLTRFLSLRGRRLVVGERENGRARGRHARKSACYAG